MSILASIWSAIKVALRWVQEPGSWKAILVGCALASVAYGVVKVQTQRKEIVALHGAVTSANQRADTAQRSVESLTKAAEANTQSIRSRNEMLELISKQSEKDRAESIAILKENKEWANQPVPDALLDRLRKASRKH